MLQNPLLINKSTIKSNILDGQEVVNLLDKTFRIPPEFSYNIVEISSDYIARMDLLSKRLYGTIRYQDVLCKLNGISNPFELNEGMKIIVPHPEDILNFVLHPIKKAVDTTVSDDQSIVISANPMKQKREKRQANEAIVGDERFRIDRNSRIIIY
jgi:hypothetical protein